MKAWAVHRNAVMYLAASLLFGLVVGLVGRLLLRRNERSGWFVSMLIGVVGAIVANFGFRALGFYREGEPIGFLVPLLGAIGLVTACHVVARRRSN